MTGVPTRQGIRGPRRGVGRGAGRLRGRARPAALGSPGGRGHRGAQARCAPGSPRHRCQEARRSCQAWWGAGVWPRRAGRRPQRATWAWCAGRAVLLTARRAQRLGCAVSHGRRSGAGPRRRGRSGVRGPARPVARSSCLSVPHTAAMHRESGTLWASCLGVGHTGLLPRACAQAQIRQAGGHPEGGVLCPCGP